MKTRIFDEGQNIFTVGAEKQPYIFLILKGTVLEEVVLPGGKALYKTRCGLGSLISYGQLLSSGIAITTCKAVDRVELK